MTHAGSPVPDGVIPPVVTALTPSGALDLASQEAVCTRQLEAGVHGLFVAGTTGEGAYLTQDVLGELVDVVVRFTAGAVPVLVGALAPGTPGVIAAARAAEAAGADGVVVTTPFYGAVSAGEITTHFRAAAAATALPVLAYSIPPMTHLALPLPVLEELFADDVVVGFKDSGHDWDSLASAIDLGHRYGKSVYAGYEPFGARAIGHGGNGLVASFCNVDPGGIVRLWESARSGAAAAEGEQARLVALIDGFATLATHGLGPTSAWIAGIKAALELMGVLRHRAVLSPLTALPEELLDTVRAQLEIAGLA